MRKMPPNTHIFDRPVRHRPVTLAEQLTSQPAQPYTRADHSDVRIRVKLHRREILHMDNDAAILAAAAERAVAVPAALGLDFQAVGAGAADGVGDVIVGVWHTDRSGFVREHTIIRLGVGVKAGRVWKEARDGGGVQIVSQLGEIGTVTFCGHVDLDFL